MTVVAGSYSGWQLGLVVIWFVILKCSAMDLSEMDRMLGEAVTKCLVLSNLTVKDAAAMMRIDESHFRKALRGEGYRLLALNHLIRLGPMFMVHLTASLMWLTAKQRAIEIVETVQIRKGA